MKAEATGTRRRGAAARVCLGLVGLLATLPGGPVRGQTRLETWESACGAVSLRVAAGLLGDATPLHQVKARVRTDAEGATSLAAIAKAAEGMGLYATGFGIRSEAIEECTVPLIAHMPPRHFAVLIGLGKGRGVAIVDAPRRCRKMAPHEMAAYGHRNVLAVSRRPIATDSPDIDSRAAVPALKGQAVRRFYGGLEFDDAVWDFGLVRPGTLLKHEFKARNRGAMALGVGRIVSDCACLDAKAASERIEPGAEWSLAVELRTSRLQGALQRRIAGVVQDAHHPAGEVFVLYVAGEVSKRGELVTVPGQVLLGEVVRGRSVRRCILLRRRGPDPLRLEGLTCSCPLMRARVLSSSAAETVVEIEVHARAALGDFALALTVETDHPAYPKLTCPVRGTVVPDVTAEPRSLYLGVIPRDAGLKREIRLRSITGSPLSVQAAWTDDPHFTVSATPVRESDSVRRLLLCTTRTPDPGIVRGEVVVRLDEADAPAVRVPYIGIVLPASRR